LSKTLSKLGLYRNFPNNKFTTYNEQHHQVVIKKSQGFFEAMNLADNGGAHEILKFLSTEDVCRLEQICKKTLASKEANEFIIKYFKNLFMGLDYDVLVNIREDFSRDKEFVLDAACEINNADKYNIDAKKIQELIASVPNDDDKRQIHEAFILQNSKITHLLKFYNISLVKF